MGNPNPDKKTWTIMLFIEADGALANFAVDSLKQLANSFNPSSDEKNHQSVGVVAQFAFPGDAANAISANAKASGGQTKRANAKASGDQTESANAEASGDQTKLYIFKDHNGTTLASHDDANSRPASIAHVSPAQTKTGVPGEANPSESTALTGVNVSESTALKGFLKSVHDRESELGAKHYALILWGHGPELLLQPGVGTPSDSRQSMYITPEQLRDALEYWTKDLKYPPLDIIGFDACSMSIFEMACELNTLAKYMVASQEEVPDQSFPYGALIKLFRKHSANEKLLKDKHSAKTKKLPNEAQSAKTKKLLEREREELEKETESLLRNGVEEYVGTYKEYIFNQDTGLKPVTLSALRLNQCDVLKKAVRSLADELLKAKDVEGFKELLIEARKKSQDYAGGLYVDLSDFCNELSKRLPPPKPGGKADIQTACTDVQNALKASPDSIILVNAAEEISKVAKGQKISVDPKQTRHHGISIYLPYLTVEQFNKVNQPLVKGNQPTHGGKGYSDMLNGAATEYLLCARRDLILVTESYYAKLQMATPTKWYAFITEFWTKALIETDPVGLDLNYSAQQSWMNLLLKH